MLQLLPFVSSKLSQIPIHLFSELLTLGFFAKQMKHASWSALSSVLGIPKSMLRSSNSLVGGPAILCRYQVCSSSIEAMNIFSKLVIMDDSGELAMACFHVLGLMSVIGYDSDISSFLTIQKRSKNANFFNSLICAYWIIIKLFFT